MVTAVNVKSVLKAALCMMVVLIGLCSCESKGYPENENGYIPTYILTQSGPPNSYDPKDADRYENLFVARMIYLRPIEVSTEDELDSLILSEFRFDKKKKQVKLTVNSGLVFEDGQPITSEDVALSIARISYIYPNLPFPSKVTGVKEWVKKGAGLVSYPKGISVNGNVITINFNEGMKKPFFRLTLELYSIIPAKCINKKTTKIICDDIPESGRYRTSSLDDSGLVFEKRMHNEKLPPKMKFKFWKGQNIARNLETLEHGEVVDTTDAELTKFGLKPESLKYKYAMKPTSSFKGLVLTPKYHYLAKRVCRKVYADFYKKTLEEILGEEHGRDFQSSLFTKVLPGYIDDKEFEQLFPVGKKDYAACVSEMKRNPPLIGGLKENKEGEQYRVVNLMYKKLGVKARKIKLYESFDKFVEGFVNGEFSQVVLGSGFWALDPATDVKMLFTPGMHKRLMYVARDVSLQKGIEKAYISSDLGNDFKEVNKQLYKAGYFNILWHQNVVFIAKDAELVERFPMGHSDASPWHFFQNKAL